MSARPLTPGQRARRALLVDAVVAAALAVLLLSLTAGLGVVAFFALPVFLAGLLWVALERGVRRLRSTPAGRSRAASPPERQKESAGRR